MLYVISATDIENSLHLRRQHRDEHRTRLRELQQQGRLVLAGPLPRVDSTEPGDAGFSGSLIVAEFASLDDARDWAENDIYQRCGVYSQVQVNPLIQVLP